MRRIAPFALPVILVCAACGGGGGGSDAPAGPTVSIELAPTTLLPGEAATATITFSGDVTGFVASDITVAGATAGTFTAVDAKTYTLALTAGAVGTNVLDVDVPAGVCTNTAGGRNAAAEGHAAIAHAPWGTTGRDSYGVYADLSLTNNSITAVQRFRLMAPGTFLMGTPSDEPGRLADREDLHHVILTTPYWLADSECTQRLWQAVTNTNPSYVTSDDLAPVTMVSWNDIQTFLSGLNALSTTLQARLPTEAEWEYAARAGTTTAFAIASVDVTTVICRPDVDDPYITTGTAPTQPVRVKTSSVNAWGLYEMHGNVGEFCSDWWTLSLGTATVTDPIGPATGTHRARRPGAYIHRGSLSRSGMRSSSTPSFVTIYDGLRIAAPNAPSGSG